MSNTVDMSAFDQLVEDLKEDIAKFNDKGNKSAGTRARKSLMEISKVCKTLRSDIQDIKNAA